MDGLRPGRVLADRYLLVEPLRRGGGALLWRALDQPQNRDVALKFVERGDAQQQLSGEYERLKRIDHPGVVRALAFHDEGPYLVLELIDGPELRSAIGVDHRKWIPPLRNALDGLAAAHAAGVAHGDVSLSNILTGDDGRGRLVDFGAAAAADPQDDVRALGTLIHMLITGQQPDEALQLLADKPVPPALRQLVIDLLQPQPPSLGEVRSRLDSIIQPAGERFERITPTERSGSTRPVAAVAVADKQRRWGPFVVLAMVALTIVVAVVAWSRFGGEQPVRSTTDTVDEAGSRLQAQRVEAQQLRVSVTEKWRQLESMDVVRWAQLRAEKGRAHLQLGEELAERLDSLAALRELRAADELFAALLAEAPDIAAFHREAGAQAMRAGDSEAAATHMRVVLAIQPGDEAVRESLRRTKHLDEVNRLRLQAQQHEADGDLAGALKAMQRAAQTDPDNASVEAQIARLQAAISSDRFGASMSAAYAALRSGDFAAAREAIASAARLRPDAPEVRDARTQVQVAERGAAIRALRERAERAEAAEDWEQAIGLYGELLQLDDALVVARQRRDRARLLASLTARAQTLLDNPEFERDEPRRQARAVIEQITALQADAPSLRALATRLEQRLDLSGRPVAVQLESDNQTEVTIFRVGRLGRFANHEMELLPGRYTVVGVRDGFRDVRRELVVPAGEPVSSFVIQCEERI